MRVFVYYNLHRKCLSVRSEEGASRGRVIAHARAVDIKGADFKVSQAGRERVLREKAKNVHAGVKGTLEGLLPLEASDADVQSWKARQAEMPGDDVTYNPYKWSTFVRRADESAIAQAQRCMVVERSIRAH
jgi:hypothetical protein